MKEVAQKGGLCPKDFPGLQPNPFSAVSQSVDLTIEAPTRATSAMAPTPTHFIHFTKGGGVKRFGAAQGLRCRQPYFFPIPRPFTLSGSGCHRANHAAVRLGHHMLCSHCGQNPERLLIFLLKHLLCSTCILQGRITHRTGIDLKTVMLQHPRRRMFEGVLTTKIG